MTDLSKKPPVITAEDVYAFAHRDPFDENKSSLFPKEKEEQLIKDMQNPESALCQYFRECDDVRKGGLREIMLRSIASQDEQMRELLKDHVQLRAPTPVALERQRIVNFVRQAVDDDRLTEAAATEILAAGGETISWMDSPADRMLMEEPLVPFRGSAMDKRHRLANMSAALAGVMDNNNQDMSRKLAEYSTELAAELAQALEALRKDFEIEMKRNRGSSRG